MVSLYGYGPAGPRDPRSAFNAREQSSPPEQDPPIELIPIANFVAKSRSGYMWVVVHKNDQQGEKQELQIKKYDLVRKYVTYHCSL